MSNPLYGLKLTSDDFGGFCGMQDEHKCFSDKTILAIPVYNEQDCLDRILTEAYSYVRDILVVDDGSTDRSGQILAERGDIALIRHAVNEGYGCSLIDAIEFGIERGYEWLISMDCDGQHQSSQIPDFRAAIAEDRVDIVSGSRYLPASRHSSRPPAERMRINRIITDEINTALDLNLTDAFCGFKAMRLSALSGLSLTESGYAFPMQFWVQAAFQNLRIREMPVSLIYNDPDRHFGGRLDDPAIRLNHYRRVLHTSLRECHREAG